MRKFFGSAFRIHFRTGEKVDPSGAARFPSSGLRWVRLGELAFLERELSL
jgi:hypothetical protein